MDKFRSPACQASGPQVVIGRDPGIRVNGPLVPMPFQRVASTTPRLYGTFWWDSASGRLKAGQGGNGVIRPTQR